MSVTSRRDRLIVTIAGLVLVAAGIFFVAGPLIYFGSRAWRRTQGIDLDLAYAEIPPE